MSNLQINKELLRKLRKDRVIFSVVILGLSGGIVSESYGIYKDLTRKPMITDKNPLEESMEFMERTKPVDVVKVKEERLAKENNTIKEAYNKCMSDTKFVMMCNALDLDENSIKEYLTNSYDALSENIDVNSITKMIFDNETDLLNRAGADLYNYFMNDTTGKTILKYSTMYRIDPILMYGLFKQESNLDHNAHLPGGSLYSGAIGIGQHERTTLGTTYVAHNYATNTDDTFTSNSENLLDLDNNIKATIMRVQNFLVNIYNGNVQLTLTSYNFGFNACDKLVKAVASDYGMTKDQVINSNSSNVSNSVSYHQKNLSENPSAYFNTSSDKYGDGLYVKHIIGRIVGSAQTRYVYGEINKQANRVTILDFTDPENPRTVITTYDEYCQSKLNNNTNNKELAKK